MQWGAGASLWNPNPWPSLAGEAGHKERPGSFPPFPGCSGYPCLSPTLGLSQGVLQCMDASGRISMLAHFMSLPWASPEIAGLQQGQSLRGAKTLWRRTCLLLAPHVYLWRAPGGDMVRHFLVLSHSALWVPIAPAPALSCSLHPLPEHFGGRCLTRCGWRSMPPPTDPCLGESHRPLLWVPRSPCWLTATEHRRRL